MKNADDYLNDVDEAPLDTLDAHPEIDKVEDDLNDFRRLFGGSWIFACLVELYGVLLNSIRLAFQIAAIASGRQPAAPPVMAATQVAAVEEHQSTIVQDLGRSEASIARGIRSVAARIAVTGSVDPELIYRAPPEARAWLIALSTSEADALRKAALPDILAHAQGSACIAGVRTPDQVKDGIAGVVGCHSWKAADEYEAEHPLGFRLA